MRLLLSLFDDPVALSNEKISRTSSLLLIDTSSNKKRFIRTPVLESPHAGITGLDYSGDWLCANLFNVDGDSVFSYLYLTHLTTGRTALHELKFAHYAHDLVSVYPGQVYTNCISTDTMVGALFSPATGQIIREDIHFTLPNGGYGRWAFNSMCNYRSKWYASMMMDPDGNYNGVIIELSNQRAIYSNVNKPNSIFFNTNHRLCFCEAGAGKIHLGDQIAHVGGYPQGIVEDQNEGGYWVAVHLLPETALVFVKYNGELTEKIIPLDNLHVFKIVEVKGVWLNQLL
jgi:hypothetical protein